ncbi:MAG: arginase family protein [Nanoarchaeota archaeon]|nr:arginase family protein [Nanoarchaeota archaeon]
MIIVKVPGLNSMGKTNGCRNAGNAIIAELDRKIENLEEIHVDNINLEEQNKLIYKNSKEMFESQDRVIFLGGDHSISFGIGKSFLDYCKENWKEPCLIVFDAHADCCKPGKEPTHEEWLRALVENGFPKHNILLVGIRKIFQEEQEFLNKFKIKRININDLINNLEDMTHTIMEFSQDKELYVSLDIDVVDPVFAPATGYKEVGGLTSRQILCIISKLKLMKNLKALDIVEVDVEKDKKYEKITTKLASKILSEFF